MSEEITPKGAGPNNKRVSIRKRSVALLIVGALVFGAAACWGGVFLWSTYSQKYTSRAVDFGLRDIGELATQEGFFTSVQSIQKDRNVFGVTVPGTNSKYIFSYDGVVKAGLNFDEIEFDVDEDSKAVRVVMPEARILNVTVDENSLVIYNETKNVFSPLKVTDLNRSMIEMKKEITEKAIHNGILKSARSNAEVLIRGFLINTFPADTYTMTFEWPKGDESK